MYHEIFNRASFGRYWENMVLILVNGTNSRLLLSIVIDLLTNRRAKKKIFFRDCTIREKERVGERKRLQ